MYFYVNKSIRKVPVSRQGNEQGSTKLKQLSYSEKLKKDNSSKPPDNSEVSQRMVKCLPAHARP